MSKNSEGRGLLYSKNSKIRGSAPNYRFLIDKSVSVCYNSGNKVPLIVTLKNFAVSGDILWKLFLTAQVSHRVHIPGNI